MADAQKEHHILEKTTSAHLIGRIRSWRQEAIASWKDLLDVGDSLKTHPITLIKSRAAEN